MKIALLGSGNVATHLGSALLKAGHQIIQVWSPNKAHAAKLAELLNAEPVSNIQNLSPETELYIIAVKDDAIAQTAARLKLSSQLIVHTSGSTDMDVLKDVSQNFGVIYPVQTFTKQKALDFKNIPVAIEGSNPTVAAELLALAEQISNHTVELDSVKRQALHIAAVFACNFTNYMYTVSEKILAEQNLDFNLIRPLITETAAKVQELLPRDAQTGPAVRNDEKTIRKHLSYLKKDPKLQELYKQLSQAIVNFYSKP